MIKILYVKNNSRFVKSPVLSPTPLSHPPFPSSFREALRIGSELYHTLKGVIHEKYGQDAINVGDEGGFAPNILENSEGEEESVSNYLQAAYCRATTKLNPLVPNHISYFIFSRFSISSPSMFLSALELLQTAIEKAGFTDKVVVGMDVAASEFYREGKYDLDFKSEPDPQRHITAEELADIYQGFVNNYPGATFLFLLMI